MTYNFDEIIPRRGTNCVKWDETPDADIIPLWVADMDFRAFPPITEALRQRVEHGVFGYTHVPQSYYECVIQWYTQRHQVLPYQPEDIIVTIGVVPALSAIVHALTLSGDKVLLLSPVYNCFFSSIRNQGRIVEDCPLHYEETPASVSRCVQCDGGSAASTPTYTIDWDDFERRCADPRVHLFLFCNPHNPAGRVWTRDEVQRIHDICMRHQVFVVADEIHGEFVMPGYQYTSYASLGVEAQRNCALCVAASKAFNVAGLQTANILVADPQKRERIEHAISLHEISNVNPFGILATQAAFTDGGAEWLQQLNAYIWQNYLLLSETFARQLPHLPVVRLEGTYLAWVDCSALGKCSKEIAEYLYRKHRVWVNDGEMYGAFSRPFIRINLACPRAILEEGLRRLTAGLCQSL